VPPIFRKKGTGYFFFLEKKGTGYFFFLAKNRDSDLFLVSAAKGGQGVHPLQGKVKI